MHRYTHSRRPKNAPMKRISRLECFQNGAIFPVGRFGPIHGLMPMRIKTVTDGIKSFRSELGHVIQKLPVDQLEALAIILVRWLTVNRQRVFETIDDRDQRFDGASSGPFRIFPALLLDPLSVIVEIRLPALDTPLGRGQGCGLRSAVCRKSSSSAINFKVTASLGASSRASD